jgi:hypothetical protein
LPVTTLGRTLRTMTDPTDPPDSAPGSPDDLARRYVALWNEPDAEARRVAIRQVWAPDGGQLTTPPQEIVEAARSVGFPAPPLAVRGHRELEARVTHAYEEFIGSGKYVFRAAGRAQRLGDVLTLRWEMVPAEGGDVAGAGLDFLTLDGDDRIRMDHQFVL